MASNGKEGLRDAIPILNLLPLGSEMKYRIFKLCNSLYKHFYIVYRPLYNLYKAISDRKERNVVRQYVKAGMTTIDVGANIGNYALFLSELVGSKGMVFAFEPAPDNLERLEKNARARANIKIVSAAVSDMEGKVSLYLSDDLNVDHCTYDSGDGRDKVDVPAVTLDAYFKPGREINFIKIDVQGYGWHVLKGAERIIEENTKLVIIIEFWPYGLRRAGTDPKVFLQLIESLGFTIRSTNGVTNSTLDHCKMHQDNMDSYCNLLLTR